MRVHGYRPWIPITAIVIALLLFFGNRWYRSPEVQQKIRSTVEATLSDVIAGDAKIDSIHIGLLSVHVSGLDLNIPLNALEISVDEIQIGFSLAALLKKEWKPQELMDRITVVRPHITITPGKSAQQTQQNGQIPTVHEMIPFRKASMKECIVSLRRPNGAELITVRGLDGEIYRVENDAEIKLNGAVSSLLDNFSINAYLSDDVEEQRLSVRLKGVQLDDLVSTQELTVQGSVDGSIEVQFQEGVFPGNVKPDGWLTVKEIALKDTTQTFVDDAIVEFFFDEERIYSRSFRGNIPGGAFTSSVNLLLGDSVTGDISSAFELTENPSIPALMEVTGSVGATVKVNSHSKEGQELSIVGKLVHGNDSYSVDGRGLIGETGVDFQRVKLNTSFGKIATELSFLNGALSVEGDARIRYRVSPAFTLAGTLPFRFFLDTKKENPPKITIDSRGLRVISESGALPLPDLKLQTIRESMMLQGKDRNMSLIVHVADFLNPFKLYHGELKITSPGLLQLTDFSGQKGILKDGAVSIEVDGEEGVTSWKSGVTASGDFGKVSLFGTGNWGGKQNQFVIDNGVYEWKELKVPFTANLVERRKGWGITFKSNDNTLTGSGSISKDFSEILNFTGEFKAIPVGWLNTLLPEEEIIIRDGSVGGTVAVKGKFDSLEVEGDVALQNLSIGSLDAVHTQLYLSWKEGRGFIPPFTVSRHRQELFAIDTVLFGDTLDYSVGITRLDLGRVLSFMEGDPLSGTLSGTLSGNDSATTFNVSIPTLIRGELKLDTVSASGSIIGDELVVDSLKFKHGESNGVVSIRYPLTNRTEDTLHFKVNLEGDLLESVEEFSEMGVGGTGEGSLYLDAAMASGDLILNDARLIIPQGEMTVYPYVRGTIDNFYLDVKATRSDSVSLILRGEINRKKLAVQNDYNYSKDLKPITFGNLDLGVIRLFTEEGGVPLFVPGFLENRKGNVGFIEVAGKDSIPAFTLSGTPPDDFLVTGTLLLRKAEITFPLLEDVEWLSDFDPFPFVGFDLDIQPADRSVTYFYRVGDIKKRRSIKLVECTLDPSRTVGVRGRDQDGDFRVTGEIRSYKGFLFYGKMFDQNFELGLDFSSGKTEGELHDNIPIIWGSAETFSDTNRYDRSEVVIMTRDEEGNLHRRGRFTELIVVPASGVVEEDGNIDEQGADFYTNTGRDIAGIEGAGNTLTGIGDRYVNSFVFNYWGRQMARHMGLDMIMLETSMMSNTFNYLYDYQMDSTLGFNLGHMALANTGITVGKYVANDQLLLKMRTQFSTLDTSLIPEYKLGVEYQPLRYLWMDLNYGIKHDYNTGTVQLNPEMRLQVRMPFSKLQEMFER